MILTQVMLYNYMLTIQQVHLNPSCWFDVIVLTQNDVQHVWTLILTQGNQERQENLQVGKTKEHPIFTTANALQASA